MDGFIIQRQPLAPEARQSRWETIFFFLTAAFSSTILLKIESVQYLELLYLVQIGVLIAAFCARGYQATWFRPFYKIGLFWVIFCVTALALAIASLRMEFYLPENTSPLKAPFIISIVRTIELSADVVIMLYLAHRLRQNARNAQFIMRTYFWVGVASAIYSVLSYPLDLLNLVSLGSYSELHRFRGFYNEGGPYGIYLLSVLLVGIALRKLAWEAPKRITWSFILLVCVFVKAYSKAAILAALLFLVLNALLASSVTKRLLILGGGLGSLLVVSQFIPLGTALRAYQRGSEGYERLSHLHAKDGNFVLGRVAGAFIVPRMLAVHPITGIGWGNYGTLRNAPEYRGAAAWADTGDDPGLGFIGLAPELGLPLFFYAFVCLTLPFLYLKRIRAPGYLINLALLQPVAHLSGAQFNLGYPWVVTCFALGVASWQARESRLQALSGVNRLS